MCLFVRLFLFFYSECNSNRDSVLSYTSVRSNSSYLGSDEMGSGKESRTQTRGCEIISFRGGGVYAVYAVLRCAVFLKWVVTSAVTSVKPPEDERSAGLVFFLPVTPVFFSFFSNPRSHVDCLCFQSQHCHSYDLTLSPRWSQLAFKHCDSRSPFFFLFPFFLSFDDLFCLVSRRRAAVRHEDPLRQTGQAARLPGAPLQPGEPPPPRLTEPTPAVRPDAHGSSFTNCSRQQVQGIKSSLESKKQLGTDDSG